MVGFSWKKLNSRPENIEWLKTIYDKPLTEKQYIDGWLALPHHKLRTSRLRPARRYHFLKSQYGFFQGEDVK